MKAREYAEAIYEASKGKSDKELDGILSNAYALLKKKGHTPILPIILSELEKIEKKRGDVNELVVTVARESDREKQSDLIEKDISVLNAENLKQRTVVDDTIIGGYELRAGGLRLDNSYKRVLLDMYSKLITSNNL